jgi:hypothetical protein
MYRSVTPSKQAGGKGRRALSWLEGIIVGLAVFLGMSYLLGWLTF